jgi:hypothetical protein
MRRGSVAKTFLSLVVLGLVFAMAIQLTLKPVVTGDGSEYASQALAIAEREGTYIRPGTRSWDSYSKLYADGKVSVAPQVLSTLFKHLCKGNQQACDYNHFWAYGLISATVGGSLYGMNYTLLPLWFSTTNLLLLIGSILVTAWIAAGSSAPVGLSRSVRRECFIVISFVILSTVSWWISLAHTEIFTFSLLMPAGMLIWQRKYYKSAILLGLATAQNLFWGPVALGLCVLDHLKQYWSPGAKVSRPWHATLRRYIILIALLALHPGYYFINHGLLTPQQGMGIEAGLKTPAATLSFLVDPSNGIGWYTLGIWLTILGGIWVYAETCRKKSADLTRSNRLLSADGRLVDCVLLVSILAFVLFACSQTSNFNSGATYGPARYGLFVLGLTFPFYRAGVLLLGFSRSFVTALVGVAASAWLTNVTPWMSGRPESYLSKTRIDDFIPLQVHPVLREPEAFVERTKNSENMSLAAPMAITQRFNNTALLVASSRSQAEALEDALNRGEKISPVVFGGRSSCGDTGNGRDPARENFLGGRRGFHYWQQPYSGFGIRPNEQGSGLWTATIRVSDLSDAEGIDGFQQAQKGDFHPPEAWGRWANRNKLRFSIPSGAKEVRINVGGVLNGRQDDFLILKWIKHSWMGADSISLQQTAPLHSLSVIKIPEGVQSLVIEAPGGGIPSRLIQSSSDNRYLTTAFPSIKFICDNRHD